MKLFQNPIWLFCLFLLASCKEEYVPKINSSEQSVLVVEGLLNSNGPATIRLTRSYKFDDTASLRQEPGAQVTVESQDGASMPLYEQYGNGLYSIDQLTLDPAQTYRLHIVTTDGNAYASDYVPVLKNPAIDSVNWKRDENGIRIFANTHNADIDTGYYRWEYEETWETHAGYFSKYKMENGKVVERAPGEDVYTCWHYNNSSSILLFSTAQLASNVVFERPLIQIPAGSVKLGVRYSALVRQFALNRQGYEFYELMKKNTESLGSIFDVQPSEISGNIHALSGSSGRAIGFIAAGPIQEKRIFISKADVPDWNYQLYCSVSIEVANDPDSIQKYMGGAGYWPYEAHRVGFAIVGWFASYPECTDCTFTGGNTVRPFYW